MLWLDKTKKYPQNRIGGIFEICNCNLLIINATCERGRSRTLNLQSRNLALYPIELRVLNFSFANIILFCFL